MVKRLQEECSGLKKLVLHAATKMFIYRRRSSRTIGGTDVKVDEWNIDALIAGTQKCLSVPSGMAPITYNDRIEKIIMERKKVEKGIATKADPQTVRLRPNIISNYFDLESGTRLLE